MVVAAFSVQTSDGLRYFRDTTLAGITDDLAELRELVAAAHIPAGAWPDVASAAQAGHLAAIDAMTQQVKTLSSLNDQHIDGMTATAGNYDAAEETNLLAVAGRPVTVPDGTGAKAARPATGAAAVGAPAASATGDVSAETVLALYRHVEQLCGLIGLAGVVAPLCQVVADNARDPGPFRQSAEQSDLVGQTANRMRDRLAAGLPSLNGRWAGQAHDEHGAVASDYETRLASIAGVATEHAAAARQRAGTQNHVNTVFLVAGFILAGAVLTVAALGVYLLFAYSFSAFEFRLMIAAVFFMVGIAAVALLGGFGKLGNGALGQ